MIYRIELPEMLYNCPQFWRNFVNDAEVEKNGQFQGENTKIELEKAGGKFYGDSKCDYSDGIEFESEQAALFFKLKWS